MYLHTQIQYYNNHLHAGSPAEAGQAIIQLK